MPSRKLALPESTHNPQALLVPNALVAGGDRISRRQCCKFVVVGGVAYAVGDMFDDNDANAEPLTAAAFFTWAAITIGAASLMWWTHKVWNLWWDGKFEHKPEPVKPKAPYHDRTRVLNNLPNYPIEKNTIKAHRDFGFNAWTHSLWAQPNLYPITRSKSGGPLKAEDGDLNSAEWRFLETHDNDRIHPASHRFSFKDGELSSSLKGAVREAIRESKFKDEKDREVDPDQWTITGHRKYRELGTEFSGYFIFNPHLPDANKQSLVMIRDA